MGYKFETQPVASLKFQGNTSDNGALNIAGINGSLESADSIISGIQGLLFIGDLVEAYDAEDAVRTVKQNVVAD